MATQLDSEQRISQAMPRFAPEEWERQAVQAAEAAGNFLKSYAPISLREMEAVALLRRIDTKYVLHIRQLIQALDNLKDRYRVLEVQKCRLNRYHNLYFDTPEFELYHQHHNQQRNRDRWSYSLLHI